MATYQAQADIVLTVNVEAEGQGDPEAIEAAKNDLVTKIAEGSLDLNNAAFIQDIQIYNLRRTG
jgi:hypothetical protein